MKLFAFLGLAFVVGCQPNIADDPALAPEHPKSWIPVANDLPTEFTEAVKLVQANGMADPRGGRYVEAEVLLGTVWDSEAKSIIHGWLIPGTVFGKKQIAAPNGVVYDLVEEKGKADLAADVKTALKVRPTSRIGDSTPSLSTPMAAAMLLVSGEAKYAKEVLTSIRSSRGALEGMAMPMMFSRWNKAVTAHMRGDSKQAIRESRALLRDKDALDKAIQVETGDRWTSMSSIPGNPRSLFEYLAPLSAIISDNERRLQRGPVKVDLSKAAKLSEPERIKTLIGWLEEVDQRQDGQPGGVGLAQHAIVNELVSIGFPAVEALFECMETDSRLTRSVSFARDFKTSRHMISVSEVANTAFRLIAGKFDAPEMTVADLRAYWKENEGKGPAERQLAVLLDDAARREWANAAAFMVEPTNLVRTSNHSWIGRPDRIGDPPAGIKGEPLRDRKNPSVSDLLIQRISDLTGEAGRQGGSPFEMDYALRMTAILRRWEPRRAVESERLVSQAVMGLDRPHLNQWGLFAVAICNRYEAGDKGTLREYAEWLASDPIENFSHEIAPVFEPMRRYPTAPEVKALAPKVTKILLQSQSKNRGYNQVETLMESPAVLAPGLREAALSLLADRTVIGQVWREGNTIWVSQPHGKGGEGIGNEKDLPKQGVKQDFRSCDALAVVLTRRRSGQTIRSYWTLARRDLAIAKLIKEIKSGTYVAQPWDPWTRNAFSPDGRR